MGWLFPDPQLDRIEAQNRTILAALARIEKNGDKIMGSQAENQAAIDAVAAQVAKAKGEIVARIDELEQAANAGQTLDFSALRGDVQSLDDLNPDAPVEPPVEPVE